MENTTLELMNRPCECTKIGYQSADISVPVEIKPKATVGNIEINCCGNPEVKCKRNEYKNALELTFVQRISISLPISYRVDTTIGESTIDCGDKRDCCNE